MVVKTIKTLQKYYMYHKYLKNLCSFIEFMALLNGRKITIKFIYLWGRLTAEFR